MKRIAIIALLLASCAAQEPQVSVETFAPPGAPYAYDNDEDIDFLIANWPCYFPKGPPKLASFDRTVCMEI